MKKRTICLLLAMIMVLSIVLAGCSKTAETPAADETPATTEPVETTDNTETPEAPEETAEPALEQKTIQLMITGAGKQANSDKVWAAFNEQLQQYVPNTTVEFIDVSFDEYSEKFSQVLASGEGVDLAWTGWLINKPQNIADGNLMPLDDLLAEYGQGIVDILGENVVEIHRNAADGKLYYLPSWQGLCGERRGWLVVTEIAELAGDTWIEDTEAALNKWRNNYSEGTEAFQFVRLRMSAYPSRLFWIRRPNIWLLRRKPASSALASTPAVHLAGPCTTACIPSSALVVLRSASPIATAPSP